MHRNHKFNEHRNVEFPAKNSSSKEMPANFTFRLDKNQKVFHLLIMIFAITAFVGGKNFPSASVSYWMPNFVEAIKKSIRISWVLDDFFFSAIKKASVALFFCKSDNHIMWMSSSHFRWISPLLVGVFFYRCASDYCYESHSQSFQLNIYQKATSDMPVDNADLLFFFSVYFSFLHGEQSS